MGYINTDIPELKGYDTGVVLSNLERLRLRTEAEMEAVVAHICELAEAIGRDAGGDPETMETILRALSADQPSPSHVLPINRDAVDRLTAHLALHQRLTLYRAIVALGRLKSADPPPPPKGKVRRTAPSAQAKGRIAYMPNAFADRAYMHFAHHLTARSDGLPCRATSVGSFTEACEKVLDGRCEYCILPLENSADGKLVGFAHMILRHRLFIRAVCDVENHTLTYPNVTRFALLTLSPDPSVWLPNDHPSPGFIELLHTSAAAPSLTDLLVAASFCGLSVRRADTLPATDAPLPVCLVLDCSEAPMENISVFFAYLALEASDDPVLGYYDLIENT